MESDALYQVTEDLRQSEEYGKYMEKIGWRVVRIGNINVFVRKLGPAAIVKIQRVNWPLPWEEIDELLKRERAFMCKLEPINTGEISPGFKLSNWPLLGTKTLRVNLRPGEE